MRQPRFYLSNMGVILETPVPLSKAQRYAVAKYAEEEYKKRLRNLPSGDRRDSLVKMINALRAGDFLERPVPAHDYEREAIAYGR